MRPRMFDEDTASPNAPRRPPGRVLKRQRRRLIEEDDGFTFAGGDHHLPSPVPKDDEVETKPLSRPVATRAVPTPPPPLPGLPLSLTALDNARAWTDVRQHLTTTPWVPLVVWGPTGCGKTMGVRALLGHLQWTVLELDGVEADDTAQLLQWIRRTRGGAAVVPGTRSTAVFLDDIESFTEDARRALRAQHLRNDSSRLGPLVVTCTNPRSAEARAVVADCKLVRLWAPRRDACVRFFERTYPRAWLLQEVPDRCDLRRVSLSLQWRKQTHALASSSGVHDRFFSSSFERTRQLMLRRCTGLEWARHAEPWDVDLLSHHMPSHVQGDLEACATLLDDLACARDAMPERFEESTRQRPLMLTMAGLATALTSRARDVGALPPPPRVERETDRDGPGSQRMFRRWTACEWSDVPASLRDRA